MEDLGTERKRRRVGCKAKEEENDGNGKEEVEPACAK